MSKARSLNKAMLIGNLTRDPVLRETSSGSTIATFGVATNTSWRDSSGNVQERTEFHNIVAWNKLAEICAQILAVGMLVYIEGEIRTRTWEDEKGERRQQTEIKLIDMCLLDNKDKKGVGIEEAKETGGRLSGDALKSQPADSDDSTEDDAEKDDQDQDSALKGEDLF